MTFFVCSSGHCEYAETAVIKYSMDFEGISPEQPSIISDLREVMTEVRSCIA